MTPAHGAIYAGVEPAGLFRSDDGGASWAHVSALRDHPSRPDWQPGAGGLICHTIVPHPTDPARMWVAISAVGTFATEDGGASWVARNRGVAACFAPDPYPETGQCVHKLVLAAGEPDSLYQQNHCGVYRSRDAGRSWDDDQRRASSEFGFVMGTHPRDAATAWVIPLTHPEEGRFAPGGSLAVWRTRDRGDSWERHGDGLPQEHAYVAVLREALSVDGRDPAGVYFGTSTGQLYGSLDEGVTWQSIADQPAGDLGRPGASWSTDRWRWSSCRARSCRSSRARAARPRSRRRPSARRSTVSMSGRPGYETASSTAGRPSASTSTSSWTASRPRSRRRSRRRSTVHVIPAVSGG